MLTIFTPTYNRGRYLDRLYSSLLAQTDMDFSWIIVDDGSQDGTKEKVFEWMKQVKISIEYYYQNNKGKMQAHNLGVEKAKTELFICVDSDDMLASDAVEKIKECWGDINSNKDCIGVLAYKVCQSGRCITSLKDSSVQSFKLREGYEKYGLSGDAALIYRTQLLKKYRFPFYEGEKFVPEAYLYDQMDQEGKLYVLREKIYIVEYLEDGYSANISELLYRNPKGYFDFIMQRITYDNDFCSTFCDSIRYDAMAIAHKRKKIIASSPKPLWALWALPFGWLMYLLKYKQYK